MRLDRIHILFSYFIVSLWVSIQCVKSSSIVYSKYGDFILGGLIPLHLYNETSKSCGALRDLGSLRRVEALVYAVEEVNKDICILLNISLGYEIYDTCSYNAEALKNSLRFIPDIRTNCLTNETSRLSEYANEVLGVVGAQRSSSSIQAATLFGIYNISLVSYLSTSDELSKDERYPYFFRTVPPDRFQVNAMIDIIVKFNWKYVVFLNSDDNYGTSAQVQFTHKAGIYGICIAYTRTISSLADNRTYAEVIDELVKLHQSSSISVVILFVQQEMARNVFQEAFRQNTFRKFIWIGSDGWGNYGLEPVRGFEEAALGAFTVVPKSGVSSDYENYYQSLELSTSENPWLAEFIDTYGACKQLNPNASCPDKASISSPAHETLVIDSVQVLARALDQMQKDVCGGYQGICANLMPLKRNMLKKYILNVSFISPSNGQVEFTTNGDSRGRYSLRHLQIKGGTYTFVDIGNWADTDNGTILNISDDVLWYITRDVDFEVPKSVCSGPCASFQIQSIKKDQPCCWDCRNCSDNEIAVNGTSCEACFDERIEKYYWPHPNKQKCVKLDTITLLNRAGLIVVLSVSSVGFVSSLIITAIYVRNREETLIKASSRDLSFIILIGIIISYISAILFCMDPHVVICILRRFLPLLGTSLIYVPLGLMTVRLYRIFRAGKKSAGRPGFISPKSQVLLSLLITTIPVTWCLVWLIIQPTKVEVLRPSSDQLYLEEICKYSEIQTVGQISWDMMTVTICCIFALLTRNLPANYNQTRFIAFSVFTTLIVYIAFAPAFFTASRDYQKDLYSALGLAIQSSVILVCIFVVKLYALRYVKEEDHNALSSTRRSVPSGTPPSSPRRSMNHSSSVYSIHSSFAENDIGKRQLHCATDEPSEYMYTGPAGNNQHLYNGPAGNNQQPPRWHKPAKANSKHMCAHGDGEQSETRIKVNEIGLQTAFSSDVQIEEVHGKENGVTSTGKHGSDMSTTLKCRTFQI